MANAPRPQTTSDPREITRTAKGMLDDMVNYLRADTADVDDPKAQALFETTAEVLLGLKTAYDHYERKSERGWK